MHGQPDSVTSQVSFLSEEWRERSDVPHIYDRASREQNTTPHTITIHNARPRHDAGDLDLDDSGFVLAKHKSQAADFGDKQTIKDVYFPEMRALILAQTGATAAFSVQFYQVRSSNPAHFFNAYSLYMHCDFSPRSWPRLARSLARSADIDEKFDDWDFALYNMWRPVGGPVEQDPLVLVDASTVDRADIIEYSPAKDREDGLAALPLFNARQRLYYVPAMQEDEVLIFKQLDSRQGHAQVCPHSSFRDPTAKPDARPRSSIDIRMICAFPK